MPVPRKKNFLRSIIKNQWMDGQNCPEKNTNFTWSWSWSNASENRSIVLPFEVGNILASLEAGGLALESLPGLNKVETCQIWYNDKEKLRPNLSEFEKN